MTINSKMATMKWLFTEVHSHSKIVPEFRATQQE